MVKLSSPLEVPKHHSQWALPLSVTAHLVLIASLLLSVAWKSEPSPSSPTLQAELWAAMPSHNPPPTATVPTPNPVTEAKPMQASVVTATEPENTSIAPQILKPPVKPSSKKIAPFSQAAPSTRPPVAQSNIAEKEALRAKEVSRMHHISQAVNLGGAAVGASAPASSTQALTVAWGAKLKACVQPNMRFSDSRQGNPKVELLVKLSPTGSPLDVSVSKPSGLEAFDVAVQRAVRRCDPFPALPSGSYPSTLTVVYHLNE